MTKKQLQELATELRALNPGEVVDDYDKGMARQWRNTVRIMADMCARSSPRFDRERFYNACGYDS